MYSGYLILSFQQPRGRYYHLSFLYSPDRQAEERRGMTMLKGYYGMQQPLTRGLLDG